MNLQHFESLLQHPVVSKDLAQFNDLLSQLSEILPFRKGSISKIYQLCGKKNCRCKKDSAHRHGPYYYWTLKRKGKTVTLSLKPEQINLAQRFIQNAKHLDQIIKNLAHLSDSITTSLLKN